MPYTALQTCLHKASKASCGFLLRIPKAPVRRKRALPEVAVAPPAKKARPEAVTNPEASTLRRTLADSKVQVLQQSDLMDAPMKKYPGGRKMPLSTFCKRTAEECCEFWRG